MIAYTVRQNNGASIDDLFSRKKKKKGRRERAAFDYNIRGVVYQDRRFCVPKAYSYEWRADVINQYRDVWQRGKETDRLTIWPW